MNISEKNEPLSIFFQFSYYPLIWMFQSRKLSHIINKVHEHALRVVYNDHQFNFEEVLKGINLLQYMKETSRH